MEQNLNDVSPLASFPNEHPTPPIHSTRPFFKSKIFLSIIVIILLIGISGFAGTMFLGKKQAVSQKIMVQKQLPPTQIPTPTVVVQTPMAVTADWQSYTNPSYEYQIKYDKDTSSTVANTATYGYTTFSNGCFKIYAVPTENIKTIPVEQNGIPWNQIDDLKSLAVGATKNCSVLTFTFGEDRKAVVNKNDYQRLADKTIADTTWYAYLVNSSNNPNVTSDNVYFTEKNGKLYLIEAQSGGQCANVDTNTMFSTFSFTK